MRLEEGMTFTIEPMINLGTEKIKLDDDGWTFVTLDGLASAHFEHNIALHAQSVKIRLKGK